MRCNTDSQPPWVDYSEEAKQYAEQKIEEYKRLPHQPFVESSTPGTPKLHEPGS